MTIGYHFTGDKLRNGDVIPPIGKWITYSGEVIPCVSGLHASPDPFDALKYAPGPILHKVEIRGDITPHGDPLDKWVARSRRILKSADLTHKLRLFACEQALSVIHLWNPPDIIMEYLTTCDESKLGAARAAAHATWASTDAAAWAAADAAARAATDAADAAARAAARAATDAAARSAAWAAARAATDAAARAATRAATDAAAWAAARAAAKDAAWAAARASTDAAAWDAERAAARAAARKRFNEIAEEALS